jgi:GATA-binding protein
MTVLLHAHKCLVAQSLFDGNGLPASQSVPHKPHASSNGSNSPASHADNPSVSQPSNIAPQYIFDGVSIADHTFQASGIPPNHLRHQSPSSTSSPNDRHLEPPQSYENLLRDNTVLKTRVSELEVVNDLYRGHVSQYSQGQAAAPQAEMIPRDAESQLRVALLQAEQHEVDLKRQVEALQRRIADLEGEPPAKRARKSDDSNNSELPEAASSTNGLHN